MSPLGNGGEQKKRKAYPGKPDSFNFLNLALPACPFFA
jgi:hypothetical protein